MSQYIQLHMLTAYPPSNPNRDDQGTPKTATIGGIERMRISSQSLKRAWRTSGLFETALNQPLGTRTRHLGREAYSWLQQAGMPEKQAFDIAKTIAGVFGKLKPPTKTKDKKTTPANKLAELDIEQLAHVSHEEWNDIKTLCATLGAQKRPPTADELDLLRNTRTSVDIALFGRMLASKPEFNIEAACQVAHAIGVSDNNMDDDYFTAVDDLNAQSNESGAGHLGDQGFGCAIYYTYICLNRDQLRENLGGDEALTRRAIAAFTEAAAKITPGGKQNSFASRVYASYLLAELGEQQPRSLIAAFYRPTKGDNHLEEAITRLQTHCQDLDDTYGACASARMTLCVTERPQNQTDQPKITFAALQDFICTPLPGTDNP